MAEDISSSLSIAVSPPSAELSLNPGDSFSGTIYIVNPDNATSELFYSAYVAPYSVKDLTYEADLITKTSMTRLTDWITLEADDGVVPINSKTALNYTIDVPADAPNGGQYAAIMVQTTSDTDKTVSEVYEIASILFAEIGGNNKEGGELISIKTPSFLFSAPITTTIVFSNTGDVHETAKIHEELRSALTNELIFPDVDKEMSNSLSEIIMPGTTREVAFSIGDVPILGVYNLQTTVEYLGETTTNNATIFVCPIWFMLMVAASVTLIIMATIVTIKRKVKK